MPVNPIKRLAGETAIYGLGTMVPRFLNYLLVPFYTIMVFNQAEYGQITVLYSWVALLLVLLTYGMETSFFRYVSKSKNPEEVFNTAATSLLITSVLFISIIIAFTAPIAQIIDYPSNKEYILYIGIIIGVDAFTALPFARMRYQNKARRFSTIRILSVLITIALNILFLWVIPNLAGEKLNELPIYRSTNLVTFVFIANTLGSLATLALLIPELSTFKISINWPLLRKMLAYGLPILVVSLSGMINEVADKIMLKYLLPDSSTSEALLGIYSASYKLAIIMMLFIQMFRYAAEPFFFAESEKSDAKQIYSQVMTYFVIFCWFIFLGVMLYISIFKYFIGPAFWAGLSIVPIVLAAKLFLGVFYNLSVWYKLTNKTLYGAIIAVVGSVLTIVLNAIWIPKYGYIGAAWANFVCYFIIMVVSFIWGRQIYRIDYQYKKIVFYTLLAVGIYYISRQTDQLEAYLQLTLNTILLMVFVLITYLKEVKKTSINKKNNG
jgi:O-antigen/teichoic acid export membrane protein